MVAEKGLNKKRLNVKNITIGMKKDVVIENELILSLKC